MTNYRAMAFPNLTFEACIPPTWAHGGHLQTMLGHLLPSPRLTEAGERWQIDLADGDRIFARYLAGHTRTLVYLFHGLGGSIEGTYMHRTARLAQELGHHVVLANHRGCGEGEGHATLPYHSGRAEDLSAVIALGRKTFPQHRHYAIGFSLSGNALLLLAAVQRASVLPDIAIAVNAPIALDRASRLLTMGLNRIYDLRFMMDLRKRVPAEIQLKPWATVFDLDAAFTAPYGGFKSREHYYEECSAKRYLDQIQIPTLLLTAADDPFVDVQDYRAVKTSRQVHIHIEDHGGHMGYLTKKPTPLGTRRWLDYAIRQSLQTLADQSS